MKKILLIRYGEIALKKLNRPKFEQKLVTNIRQALEQPEKYFITRSQARTYIERKDNVDVECAIGKVLKVFGISSLSIVYKISPEIDLIYQTAVKITTDLIAKNSFRTFKVESRRGDKSFPLDSMELSRETGKRVLDYFPDLRVDVHSPDFTIYIEVREFAYLYSEIIPGYGGLPVGTNSKALLLLSGGIDSPVAGWMIAKRGVELDAIHFYSYPYTSQRSKDKVIELSRILSESCGILNLHVVPFTDIQVYIRDHCPGDETTLIMRRVMMQIAESIALANQCEALVTGEAIGQVASQTVPAIFCIDNAANIPVFRPLLGLDKQEVIAIARRIGTYETSILPYEDCCTVFVNKHPKTKPRLSDLIRTESKIDPTEMIKYSLANTEIIRFQNGKEITNECIE